MILAHIIRVFENVARQDSNYRFFGRNMTRCDKLSNAGHGGGRGGLATNTLAADHRLGFSDFLFGHGDDLSVGAQDGP